MAVLIYVFVAATIFLLTCRAAPTEDGSSTRQAIKTHPNCQEKGFCPFQPEGYDKLVEQMNSVLPKSLIQEYGDRISPEPFGPRLSDKEDWNNCPYWTQNELMYTYRYGVNDSKIDILVQTDFFRQYVETVTCAREYIPEETYGTSECFRDLNLNHNKGEFDMNFSCENSYTRRNFYVYDKENNRIVQKTFPVPSCCSCKVVSF